jgi:hypothetical protein
MSDLETTMDCDTDGMDRHRHGIFVTINGQPYETTKCEMDGREILRLAGLPETNQLFLETGGPGDDVPIGLDTRIEIVEGMAFYDVPVGTFG